MRGVETSRWSGWILSAAFLLAAGCSDVLIEGEGGEMEDVFRAASDAVDVLVYTSPPAGDPAYGYLDLELAIDDAVFREAFPDFDGLERVYADVPGKGRFALGYRRTEDGLDVHQSFGSYYSWEGDAIRQQGVTFGVATNVGDFPGIAHAHPGSVRVVF